MKMKKVLALVLCSAIAFSAIACSKDSKRRHSDDDDDDTEESLTIESDDGEGSEESDLKPAEDTAETTENTDDLIWLIDTSDKASIHAAIDAMYYSFPIVGDTFEDAKSRLIDATGQNILASTLWGRYDIEFAYDYASTDGEDSVLVDGRDIVLEITYNGYEIDSSGDIQNPVITDYTILEWQNNQNYTSGNIDFHIYDEDRAVELYNDIVTYCDGAYGLAGEANDTYDENLNRYHHWLQYGENSIYDTSLSIYLDDHTDDDPSLGYYEILVTINNPDYIFN